MSDDSEDSKVVSLDKVRALKTFEKDPSVAYVEFLWGENSFAINAVIRDLEAMRRGTEDEDQPLRDPETVYEAETLIKRIRWATNFLAREWGLEGLVHPDDWQGDERAAPED